MTQQIVALLGRRDEPTDAIEQYCLHLGEALNAHGFNQELLRVTWKERGWPKTLRNLRQRAAEWQDRWVLLQYTALSWSQRGFPLQVPRVLKVLRAAGSRVAIVFHDALPYAGRRPIDLLRRTIQQLVMRRALSICDQTILTVPAEKLFWVPSAAKNVAFIPVGANLPLVSTAGETRIHQDEMPTVAVFGVTGGSSGSLEAAQIVAAVRLAAAKLGRLRLLVFGRHADLVEANLRSGLRDLAVTLRVAGVLAESDVEGVLRSSDVLLFVRGPISSRRSSAIAGIACGLPVIACAGGETAPPITDAGVVFVPAESKTAAGEALVRVLGDRDYHARLAERSRAAYKKYFSWDAIAARYAAVLRTGRADTV